MRAISALLVNIVLIGAAQGGPPQPAPAAAPVPAPRDVPYPGTITLAVDASNIAQDIFTVHETIPVAKGAGLTLLYPEWRPGNHSPTARNRIARVAGLVITANGAPVAWSRDPVNVYAFHVPLPPKVTSVEVDFQYLSPLGRGGALSGRLLRPADSHRAAYQVARGMADGFLPGACRGIGR